MVNNFDCFVLWVIPLREGQHRHQTVRNNMYGFQVMPLREGQHVNAIHHGNAIHVSSHAPTRGATRTHNQLLSGYWVSSHAPTRGATLIINNTIEPYPVSSHAPTRGATVCQGFLQVFFKIVSSHAPTRGATNTVSLMNSIILFQVMPLREGQLCGEVSSISGLRFKSCPYARGNLC